MRPVRLVGGRGVESGMCCLEVGQTQAQAQAVAGWFWFAAQAQASRSDGQLHGD